MEYLFSLLAVLCEALLNCLALLLALLLVAGLRNVFIAAICSLCELVARPSIALGYALIHTMGVLSEYIKRALYGLDYSSEHNDHDLSRWHGWNILSPLVYLATLIILVYGDLYVFVLRFAVLFHALVSNTSTELDLLIGLTWAAMVALWGYTFFDLLGVTPVGRPFHNLSEQGRQHWRVLTAIACILSIVSGAFFWMWGQLLLDGLLFPELAWLFVSFFASLLNAAIIVAGWSILSGLGALYALALMGMRLSCFLLYVLIVLEVRTIDALAAILVGLIDIPATLGRYIWNWWCSFPFAHHSHVLSIAPFKKRSEIGPNFTFLISCHLSAFQNQSTEELDQMEDAEVPVMHVNQRQRIINVFGFGHFAGMFFPHLWEAMAQLGALEVVRTIGILAVEQTSFPSVTLSPYEQRNILNISPTSQEIENVLNQAVNINEAKEHLTHRMIDKLVAANVAVKHPQAHILLIQDMMARREEIEQCAREMKQRQEQQSILMLSRLPHFDQRDNTLEAYTALLQLQKEEVTMGAILLDTRSEHACKYGEEKQEQHTSTALTSLLVAHTHSKRNPTYAEVASRLSKQSPFFGMAFASACFVSSQSFSNNPLLPRGGMHFAPHGLDKLNDVVKQAKTATLHALGDGTAYAIEDRVDTDKLFFLIYTVPIVPKDPCWSQFINQMNIWVISQFKMAVPIFTSGNGVPSDQFSADPFLQVSALYPLPHVPTPFRFALGNIGNTQSLPTT